MLIQANRKLLVTAGITLLILGFYMVAPVHAQNTPFVMFYKGIASAWGGYDFEIPSNNNIGLPFVPETVPAYLATYSAISGNNSMVPVRQSNKNFYATQYIDNGVRPDPATGYTQWYPYIVELIENSDQSIAEVAIGAAMTGNLSSVFNVPAGSKIVIRNSTTNSTFGPNTVCDIKAVFLVPQDLTIHPNFTRTTGNGCLFVVQNNVFITAGGAATYDRVDGFFITGGEFQVQENGSESMYIKGGVVTTGVDFARRGSPPNRPSEIIQFDGFYLDTFRNLFATREFSIREL